MKSSGFLFLSLVSSAWTAAVEKRQGALLGALGSAALKPDRVWQEKPQLRSNAKRSVARFGPFTLPAVNVSPITNTC